MKIYTNELGHMTNMAAMPIYGKNLLLLVCVIVYGSTTKVVQIMTLG